MNILQSDFTFFKKLHIKTMLDLALNVPKKYENTIISKSLNQANLVVEISVKSIQVTAKTFKVLAFCKTFNQNIFLVIFNPSKYHYQAFQGDLVVSGRYANNQIIQPKILKEYGYIKPIYKNNQKILSKITKYINKKDLENLGLNNHEAKILYDLHNPDENNFNLLDEDVFQNKTIKVLKVAEILNYLLKLSKKKLEFVALSKLSNNETPFINSLNFTLTDDQLSAIKDIKQDFLSNFASKRVIVGDVGSGKTMVILAAIYMAYPKKSILMAPTSILANQLYHEAKKYLPKEYNIAFITKKTKVKNLENFDIFIGTHALLYQKLPTCDLVIVDEQHRFGTNQRNLIQKLAENDNEKRAHYLQFSATPIPRTLAMIHSSVVKYSFIKQMPFEKNIKTKVIKKQNFKNLIEHINDEIAQNYQIAIIYPLVEESENHEYQSLQEASSYWEKNFKKVYLTYGKDKEKEEVFEKFAKDGNILLSTTVIEVGISLPKLRTIIIVGAERLGLATLHQLRGRVGRLGGLGYCFLFTKKDESQRLEEFCKTKSGFDIAELDLKYRKSGELLSGIMQHGNSFEYFNLSEDEEILKEVKARISTNI